MKVLHVSGARSWGGNEQQLIYIIPELEKLNVSNIVFGVKNSLLEKECGKQKITFICSKEKKLNKFSNYKLLKKIINEEFPDVIHLHTSDSLTVFTISDLLFNLKVPTVFSKKGTGSSSSFLSRFKYNYKNVSSIICVSEKVKNEFSLILTQKTKEKLNIIYDAVAVLLLDQHAAFNLKTKYRIPKESLLIGNIANHTKAKDLDTLIDTADYLINQMCVKNVFFIQIGEFSNLTEGFKSKTKAKNLDNQFVFTDKLNQAYLFNHQFDIFVLTSEREGGPTALIEAMFMERPIVSTNVGIIQEIIKSEQNGYISEIKDFVALAENIKTLVLDADKRKNIVKRNRELILNNNSAQIIAQKTLELYQSISK